MKTTLKIKCIAAVTVVLGLLASCQQQEVENLSNQEELVPVSLTASFSTAETKVSYTETTTDGIKLQPAWKVGDEVIGFDEATPSKNTYTFTVSKVDGTGTATLDGTCPASCTLHLIYLCGATKENITDGSLDVSYADQAGTGSADVHTMPAVMLADGEVSYGSGDFHFSNAGAVIGVKAVKGVPSGSTVSSITVSGEDLSAATIALDGSSKLALTATAKENDAISTATLSGVTVNDDNGTLSKLVLIAVPADAKVGKVTAAAGDKTYSFKLASAATLAAGRYSYIKGKTFTDDRIPVSGITLDPTSKTIDVGESFTITATVSPSDATDKTVTWTSSDPTVATVDSDGKVTGVKAGTATITASAGGKTATCTVTVVLPPYVEIAGLKWARQNLSISESGSKSWKGDNSSAVKVPGTDEDVKVGDYFQWAAYEGYCGDPTDADKGLLVYTAFTNQGCGDSSDAFTVKSGKKFNEASAPYYSGSAYDNTYSKTTKTTLVETDDVAHIILGGDWRMPTSAEFQALYDATYWAWDSTDKGCYVFSPDASHKAGTWVNSIPSSLSKSNALLFFPAALGASRDNFSNVGSRGYYWSSSLDPGQYNAAHHLMFYSSDVLPQHYVERHFGRSVRPVSD